MSNTAAPCAVPPGFVAPPRPTIGDAAPSLSRMITGRVAVPREQFVRWFATAPLERLLPAAASLPAVTGTAALTAAPFPEPGSRRLVCLSDGGSAVEEVLDWAPPDRLRYLVWGYTSAAAAPIAHAIGEFRFADAAGGTGITWTYAFELRPDRFPGRLGAAGRLLFRVSFLNGPYAAFMASGLAAIEREALATP